MPACAPEHSTTTSASSSPASVDETDEAELGPLFQAKRLGTCPAYVHATTRCPRDLSGEEPDRPRARDQHVVVWGNPLRIEQRVAHASERLHQRSGGAVQPLGNAMEIPQRHVQARCEAAVDVRADRAALE